MERPLQVYFSIIYRYGRVMHDKAMERFGMTGQQMGYIGWINRSPGISQEELAKRLRIDKGAVAKSIKHLTEEGFVEKRKNPEDRRAYCLFPTEKAVEMCAQGERCYREFEREIMKGLTPGEEKTFEELLSRVTDNLVGMMEGGNI